MAEIPIERKSKGPGWLPWLLALLLLLLLGYCVARRRGTATSDSTAASTMTTDSAMAANAAAGGAAAGAATGAATGTAGDSARSAGAATAGDANGAIEQFTQFVAQRDTARETEGQHQYTAEGVRRLAAALEGIAGGNPSIQVWADSMRSSVDRLQRSAASDVHADDAKAAFSAAVSAMAAIDKARGRTRDVAPMRAIYTQLDSKRPLVPQLPTVHRFFDAARDALQAMR